MLISYNWLKSYIPNILDEDEIANLVTFHICEIEDIKKLPFLSPTDSSPQAGEQDTVFDLKILPDRAHDLLSHQGVAREIAGLLGLEFKLPEYKMPVENSSDSDLTNLKIDIQTSGCRRYMGEIVRNIKVGPSPEWMVKFLESIGQRSINNIVDATNIVMFDCGQPIHAFDLADLPDKRIVVKEAQNGEVIELVGSEKISVVLKDKDVVITDGVKNLAIAGVKGGLGSGIKENTTDILIEVANFNPVSVRKTARRLGIQTEASKRYENDLSSTLCDQAMHEISSLIFEMCPSAVFEKVVDVYPEPQKEKTISFNQTFISKMLGLKIEENEIEKILKSYNYKFTKNGNNFEVIVPDMRLDLTSPRDFVEEIGRVYGYEKIIPSIPKINSTDRDNNVWTNITLIKQKLINDGYKEVMTYAFGDKGELEVLSSAVGKNFLRTNLTDSLKESLALNQKNLPLLEIDELKEFEIGTVFTQKNEVLNVAYGDKKNVTEMSVEKFVTEFLPREINSYNTLEKFLVDAVLRSQNALGEVMPTPVFKMWSVYPFIARDIAVWVPCEVSPETLVNIYKDFGTELLIKEPKLFDSFTKNNKTSFAYRLIFQAKDRTLTDEEINVIMKNITNKITSLGFEVR